jgi:hypothetical protein
MITDHPSIMLFLSLSKKIFSSQKGLFFLDDNSSFDESTLISYRFKNHFFIHHQFHALGLTPSCIMTVTVGFLQTH